MQNIFIAAKILYINFIINIYILKGTYVRFGEFAYICLYPNLYYAKYKVIQNKKTKRNRLDRNM